ncbi:MAG: helix-turn-helix domain-containing protein [Prevotella sp.]|nr:helix-turn-helix domain-containing protein [Prevotella sp.]
MKVLQPQLSRTINNPRITLEDLSRLADAIGCNVSDFFNDQENQSAYSGASLSCPCCGERIVFTVKVEKSNG